MRFLLDSIKMSIGALWARRVRSALSILGIVIGILTVAGLLTIALGVRREITRNIEGLGSNLIAAVPGKIEKGSASNFVTQFGVSTLTEQDFLALKFQVPEARNLSMGMLIPGTAKAAERRLDSSFIVAGSPGIEHALNFPVEKGRFIKNEDEEENAKVAVLGSSAAQRLFGAADALGKELEIRGQIFTTIGVLKEVPTAINFGGADINEAVFMPIHTGWDITGTRQIFRIMLQAQDATSVESTKLKVREVLLKNHKGEEDFSVLTQADLLDIIGNILTILTAMLSAIAAISLLVGGIGIMNIMLVAVSERSREIGIRKAVGATELDILIQFLVESILLTFLGGSAALAIFFIGIQIAALRFPIPLEVDPAILLLALAFSIIVGIVFGMIPAYRASRKDPVVALRYE